MTVRDGTPRGHSILPHTADVGVSAHGPTFAEALEEVALGLAELTADLPAQVTPTIAEEVVVRASDPEGLLVAWLNELIGLADLHHAALADVTVTSADPDRPALAARLRLVSFAAGARPRVGVKSATFHRAEARQDGAGWRLRAYLDL